MKFLGKIFARLAPKATRPGSPHSTQSPAETMREMRLGWLSSTPEVGTDESADEVRAVVLDYPIDDMTISVLASSGGDASVYTTGTFGIIGGIAHEPVRQAAIAFTHCAHDLLDLATPTTEFPLPDDKTLCVYMVTAAGVLRVSFPITDIDRADSAASAIFAASQDLVTELRRITEGQDH